MNLLDLHAFDKYSLDELEAIYVDLRIEIKKRELVKQVNKINDFLEEFSGINGAIEFYNTDDKTSHVELAECVSVTYDEKEDRLKVWF